ncbi:T9SS type A sorting domain-containing protein [candidate division WOR-3 bacterium]|nr:T9SS type A sorting domain-containing protein [candidate division WOR-3 bacterium]
MRVLVVLLAFVATLSALGLPEAGTTPANAVPFETVQELALRKAGAEWPGCRPGMVLPYVDESGQTVAWMFHFTTDGSAFPGYEQVAADVRAEREGLGPDADLTRWRSKYAALLVSARRDRAPILFYGYGTSEYYAIGQRALERARHVLGAGAYPSRIYFVSPLTLLEFANDAGQHVVYSSHFERSWDSREALGADVARKRGEAREQYGYDAAAAAVVHQQEWNEALGRDFGAFTDVFVPSHQLAPFYDWSYGCTPTAGAMTLGYIDRVREFGKLVKWFMQRRDNVEGENDWQIPYAQRECAIAMQTDTTSGGTMLWNIAPGLQTVGEDNGYTFDMVSELGSSGNDWAWATITAEIDAGWNLEWSAIWEIHSLAAYGYRTPDKDIYVHNTWWMPAGWWHYSGPDVSHVASPHTSGGDAHKLRSTYPKGDTNYNSTGRGEVLQVGDTTTVTWDNGGNPATWVGIDLSRTGGKTWARLDSVPDTGTYRWYIDPAQARCDSCRLRFRQWHNGTFTSADGTFGCFRLIREPLPPLQLSPPNGRQLFTPPVVLLVDSTLRHVDSFEFRVVQGTDTIWREKTVVPKCSLPDTLFIYNRSYKWFCRGHNQYGWGEYGPQWTFWCKFNNAVAEGRGAGSRVRPAFPSVVPLSAGGVGFTPGAAGRVARVEVFDAAGQKVAAMSGSGALVWEFGPNVNAGLYFVRVTGGAGPGTRKLLLVD